MDREAEIIEKKKIVRMKSGMEMRVAVVILGYLDLSCVKISLVRLRPLVELGEEEEGVLDTKRGLVARWRVFITGSHPYIPLRKLAVKELYRPFLCVKELQISNPSRSFT